MMEKVIALAITLLLILSGFVMVVEGNSTPIEEDVNSEDEEEKKEVLEGSSEEHDVEGSKEEGTSRRYEEGLESAFTSEDGSARYDETRDLQVKMPEHFRPSEEDLNSIEPLRIDGDPDLAELALEKGWDGEGSEEDPYVIEDHEIDGSDEGYSIYIGNVTDHFEVKGCYLHNATGRGEEYFRNSGLHLYNTSNGNIKENRMSDNLQMGIYLERSEDNVLSENTILSNGGHGILVEGGSSDNELRDNVVGEEGGYEGMIDRNNDPNFSRNEDERYQQDSILVELERFESSNSKDREMTLRDKTETLAEYVDGKTSRLYSEFDAAEIRLGGGIEVKSAVDILSEKDQVKEAEPNYYWEAKNEPNDPGYDSLWAMPTIDAPGAWNISTGSEDVVVAIIDTGIDYTHPDLKENMWTSDEGHHGYNAVNDSYHPMDDHGHGTHIAGTIGAEGDNELGVVGMNWNVSMMGLKFLDSEGRGTTGDAIASLEYVLERKREGENVVATSNSWGGAARSDLLYRVIEEHLKEDISFIAAAGNQEEDNDINPNYPANYDLANVISVAATDRNDELAGFSNYGERTVDIAAPGVDINSTSLDEEYEYMSGTSMAVPHVSGLTALLASHNATYDQLNFKNAILSSVDHDRNLQDRTLSEGRMNASRAMKTTPDPEDINLWVHRPGSSVVRGERSSVIVSLNDGVEPVLDAEVTVEFSTREESIRLEDDGTGKDQIEDDGYYSGGWTPRFAGQVTLTITALSEEGWEKTEKIRVEVGGGAGIYIQGSEDNVLSGNTIFDEEHGIYLHSSHLNELENNHLKDNEKTGLRLYDSNENNVEDMTIQDAENGILLDRAYENHVTNNNISDTDHGIVLENSRDNIVDNNTCIENRRSIYLENSGANLVTNNALSDNDHGIYLYVSEENNITQNHLSKNEIGIHLDYSTNTVLKDNIMEENGVFISGHRLEDWATHTIDPSNKVNGRPIYYWKNQEGGTVPSGAGQVILANSTGVSVENQNVSRGSGGILMAHSDENKLVGNTASEHEVGGIYLYWSHDNELIDNEVTHNTQGIHIYSGDYNSVRENNASHNDEGIYITNSKNSFMSKNTVIGNEGNGIWIDGSDNSEITDNRIMNNEFRGIDLYHTDNTTLEDNVLSAHSTGIDIAESRGVEMSNNRMDEDGVYIWGDLSEYWDSHDIDVTNTVNGRPVYYWKNEGDRTVPEGAGQVILVNCTDITVENQNVSHGTSGILLGFSDGNTVVGNDASNNDKGMRLYESDDNEIIGNNVSQNGNEWVTLSYGIWLSSSDGNDLIDNDASNNDGDGIYLVDSQDNTLIDNQALKNNWRGVDLSRSDGNSIIDSRGSGNRLAIRLQNSQDIALEGNEVQKGIELRDSEDVTLTKNTMSQEGLSIWGGRKSHWNTHDIDTSNTLKGDPIYYWSDRNGGKIPREASQVILANCEEVLIRDQDLSDGVMGIQLGFSSSNVVEENVLSGYDYAIYLRNSDGNNVSDNVISDNGYGLRLYDSDDNRLIQNNFSENENPGIDLWNSDNNTVDNNSIWENQRRGIRLRYSTENTLIRNEVLENSYGMDLTGSDDNLLNDNQLTNNRHGITLSNSERNTISENSIDGNSGTGIDVGRSRANTISANVVSRNNYAISLTSSEENVFVENNVSRNQVYGFHLQRSFENLIYHNRFIQNEDQAFDDGDNFWDHGDPKETGSGGNYWSDHEGEDRGDRIAEEIYEIKGDENKDRYPWTVFEMTHPVKSFEVIVEDITAGEEPVVTIFDVEDVHGNLVEGMYEVKVIVEEEPIHEEINLEGDEIEYEMPEVTDAGEHTAEVTIEEVTRTDDFYVETAEIDQIEISPKEGVVTAGETIAFDAFAYDKFDNGVGDVTEETEWSIEERAGGNWTENIYRGEFAGTWKVTGTYEDISKNQVDLTVTPSTVDQIQIEPRENQTILSGENIEFSAEAYDRFGNLITDENIEFSWENTDSRGRFGKTEAGEYEVRATYENISSEPTIVMVEESEENIWLFGVFSLLVSVFISIVVLKKKKESDRP